MNWQTLTVGQLTLSLAVSMALPDEHGLLTLSEASVRWIGDCVASLERWLAENGYSDDVDRLTPLLIRQWHQATAERSSVVTANTYLRGVKLLFSRLQRNGSYGTNPAGPVRRLPEPAPGPRRISEADYVALRGAMRHNRDVAIVDTLWYSGCRLGGLLSMRVDRIERVGQAGLALYVVEKGGNPRWVYVAEGAAVIRYLTERPAVSSPALWLTFDAHPGPLKSDSVYHLLRAAARRVGIPAGAHINPHAFRHAFALRMLEQHDLALVSRWLGHATPEFTARVYCVRSESELRAAYFGR